MTAHSLREQPRGTGEFSWIQEPVSTTAQSMRYDKRLGLYGEQDPTDLKCDWKTGWSNTGWWYTLDALQDVDKVSPGTVVPSTLPPPARLLYGMYVYMCRYIRYLMYRVTCVKLAAHSVSRTFLQTTGMYNECSASLHNLQHDHALRLLRVYTWKMKQSLQLKMSRWVLHYMYKMKMEL